MDRREETIRLWFDMWLRGEDFGIRDIFTEDAAYTESWGPAYRGSAAIGHWFQEWNTRGRVLVWAIHRFFHSGDQTAVTWFFQCQMGKEPPTGFEGVSVARWTEGGKISSLVEYCCEPEQYDPYRNGPDPVFDSKDRTSYEKFAGSTSKETMLGNVMVDCPDAETLQKFYGTLLGWEQCCMYGCPAVRSSNGIAFLFSTVPEYIPPVWPEEEGAQQKQMHFDFQVEDVPEAVKKAEFLGAVQAKAQFGGEHFTTMLDPAGHPFCLCQKQQLP